MWKRRTFHECADELRVTSHRFRDAYTNSAGLSQQQRDRELAESSKLGVEVLQVLALSIRSEQDYGLTACSSTTVGAILAPAKPTQVSSAVNAYTPPYTNLYSHGYGPLTLRQALNKIAHANPSVAGFAAEQNTHDLVLTGAYGGSHWVAVISVIDLHTVIELLPDIRTTGTTP